VSDSPDPPRRHYGFKERNFKRDNAPAGDAPPTPTAQDLAKLAGPPVKSGQTPSAPRADDPNEVFRVLQQNRTREMQAGGDVIEIRKRRNRRLRDYLLGLIGGNLCIVVGIWASGFNVISTLFGLGGVIIFSLSFTWIMWQLVDRY